MYSHGKRRNREYAQSLDLGITADNDFEHIYSGLLTDGVWTTYHSFYRLRLTGTGTVTIDAIAGDGTITNNVESYTITNETDLIVYPFPGASAVKIRVTYSNGGIGAELI